MHALCELSDRIAGHFVTGDILNLLLTILELVEEDDDNIHNNIDCKYHPLTMISSCSGVYCGQLVVITLGLTVM